MANLATRVSNASVSLQSLQAASSLPLLTGTHMYACSVCLSGRNLLPGGLGAFSSVSWKCAS